jgi:Na+-driven multidrug efflux pump
MIHSFNRLTKFFFRHIKSILRIGIPSGLSSVSFTFSKVFTASFIALLGSKALSANVYCTNILCYVYLVSMCMGNANALLVGRCYGAGNYDRADRMNAQLIKITTVVNLLISLLVVLLRKPLLSIFTDDQWAVDMALGVFLVDIVVEQARAISQIYEYALRATGDVVFSMVFIVASCWLFSIGLSYILAIHCGLGLVGCFIGLAADEWTRTIVTYFRWKSGKWKHPRV